jgi:hypothetical protein
MVERDTVRQKLGKLRVEWDATTVGLMPAVVGKARSAILDLGEDALPGLVAAMTDKALFVAAHVLLTEITDVEYETFPDWNGLEIDMSPDGRVTVDPGQRRELAQRWARWLEMDPRPESLPAASGR